VIVIMIMIMIMRMTMIVDHEFSGFTASACIAHNYTLLNI